MVVATVCWESCEECPEIILGCTDTTAFNYDYTAEDDGSCVFNLILEVYSSLNMQKVHLIISI